MNLAIATDANAPSSDPRATAQPAPATREKSTMTHSFDKKYWDEIWQGDRATAMAAGAPNPHLLHEVAGLAAGTALDAGCGGGTEAVWLATQGWQVTGVDIAAEALARAADKAAQAGVADQMRWVEADLSTWEPEARYDLVTTHYAHPAIPQLDFYRRIADWVAPAGMLFIVGHLHHNHNHDHDHDHDDNGTTASRGAGHGHHDGENQPPESASACAADITAQLDPTEWEITTARETHRSVTGPDGRDVQLHDVVVAAVRRS